MAGSKLRTAVRETAKEGILDRTVRQNSCPDCGSDLEQGTYKGNPSAVCTECETPAVQLW